MTCGTALCNGCLGGDCRCGVEMIVPVVPIPVAESVAANDDMNG